MSSDKHSSANRMSLITFVPRSTVLNQELLNILYRFDEPSCNIFYVVSKPRFKNFEGILHTVYQTTCCMLNSHELSS